MGYMYSQEIIGKKKKTKRIKPELIIEEKYITLKSHSRKLKKPKKVIEFEIADDS